MAAGLPVVAYGRGGAIESVTSETGIFFEEQTVGSLTEAILKLENGDVVIHEKPCRLRAEHFTKARFQRELLEQVRGAWVKAGKEPRLLEIEGDDGLSVKAPKLQE